MVFQEGVEKALEYRVTAVGDRLFVASIDSQSHDLGKDDWRRAGSGLAGRFHPATFPARVEDGLRRLMRAFGLVYGGIDLIQRPDGEFVFLEINSAGEWGWLEVQAGLPISAALADELTA